MRDLETAEACLREARDLALAIRKHGLAPDDTQGLVHAIQAGQMALTQVALFEALVDYLRRDGGSRGSYVVLKAHGDVAVPEVIDPATGKPYRYIAENESLRQEIAEFELTDADQFQFTSSAVPVRPVPHRDEIFERMWAAYRSGEIFNGA